MENYIKEVLKDNPEIDKITNIEDLIFEKMERRWCEQGFVDYKLGEPGYDEWCADQAKSDS